MEAKAARDKARMRTPALTSPWPGPDLMSRGRGPSRSPSPSPSLSPSPTPYQARLAAVLEEKEAQLAEMSKSEQSPVHLKDLPPRPPAAGLVSSRVRP